jgi:hypothetical protein
MCGPSSKPRTDPSTIPNAMACHQPGNPGGNHEGTSSDSHTCVRLNSDSTRSVTAPTSDRIDKLPSYPKQPR